MNHGFVLNDGASNIRSSYFPVSSVIVRDDPHYRREQAYTGDGQRVFNGRSHQSGRSPARPGVRRSLQEAGVGDNRGVPEGEVDRHHANRRRGAPSSAGSRALPSYMAPTASYERKHMPDGEVEGDPVSASPPPCDGSFTQGGIIPDDRRHHHCTFDVLSSGSCSPPPRIAVGITPPAAERTRLHPSQHRQTTQRRHRQQDPAAREARDHLHAQRMYVPPVSSFGHLGIGSEDEAHDQVDMSNVVSADSSVTALSDIALFSSYNGAVPVSHEEASWRAYLTTEEEECWILLMDSAMDNVADIMLQRQTSPAPLSPMSSASQPPIDAPPAQQPEAMPIAVDAHDEKLASMERQLDDDLHQSGVRSRLFAATTASPRTAEASSLPLPSHPSNVANVQQTEEQRHVARQTDPRLDHAAIHSLRRDHDRGDRDAAAPSPTLGTPSAVAVALTDVAPTLLPSELQQYLHALHYQTVVLSSEMRRVTESHALMSANLASAQREIETLRNARNVVTPVTGTTNEASPLDVASKGDVVGEVVGAADDVPVHPALLTPNDDSAAAVRGEFATVEEALEVEGAGNIARSVYHLIAYPLQCCLRRKQ